MKCNFTLLLTVGVFGLCQAQLSSPGDLAFVGFNADGDDDLAFVTFKDIPAHTTVYFCDSEWNGTGFGTDEGDFSWDSGNAVIPAGTVIALNNVSNGLAPSLGSITLNNAGGISGSGDAMFAFLGTGPRTATTLLTAISNAASGFGTLTGSGLSLGTSATLLTEGTDMGMYNGPRTGMDRDGFLAQIGSASQWLLEDTDADDHINGTTPDLPFNLQAFTLANTDATAPLVTSVSVSEPTTLELIFSEAVTEATATASAHYGISPALNISNVAFDAVLNKVTLTHAGFIAGVAYQLNVSGVKDLAGNEMQPFQSAFLYDNALAAGLVISEIMYNAPSGNSNQLEFLEIYNTTSAALALGGIKVKDEGNFVFEFPEMNVPANSTVLLANDKASADAFYGVSFIDMPQGIINALGNGGENLQILNSRGAIISQVTYDDAAPWPLSPDGNGPSLELRNPAGTLNDGNNWAPATNLVGQSLGFDVFASPGVYVPDVNAAIGFDTEYVFVQENEASVQVAVTISNPANMEVTATLAVLPVGTAIEGADFTFASQTITFPANSVTPVNVTVPLIDNTQSGADRFFVLGLSDASGATLGGISTKTVYVLDNEVGAPVASNALDVQFAGSYLVDATGSAEIVAHDPISQRLFVLNSTGTKVHILDFANPSAITNLQTIDMSSYGIGATSIACQNGLVAATVEGADFAAGKVIFMDTDGNNIQVVTAGVLPDMVTFTPNGTKVLTANEGQPNGDYSIDPEGSITVIDVSAGLGNITQAQVSTLTFNAFDNQLEALRAAGVRVFGPNATVSKDFEPEYITVSADGTKAWVSLQENNALAVIDLLANQITDILPLGLKDHSLAGNAMDVSDQTGQVFMGNWPVKGMYMPDAIASYSVNGQDYVVTANEGDVREYDALEEEAKVGAADYVLDATVFPNAEWLKKTSNLGRLVVSNQTGDTDGDGDFDEIHAFGTRSFSIRNATTGALVYDSGDDFERITAEDPEYGILFNASNDNNNFKNRSDNKGPEPEGITVAQINGAAYAFITLERTGGMLVYDITNPENATFVSYKNSRSLTAVGGDLGPEGIIYIQPQHSPLQKGMIVMANEVSATLSMYTIENDVLATAAFDRKAAFVAYPNPVSKGVLYCNEPTDLQLFDLSGRKVLERKKASSLNVSGLQQGIYLLQPNGGKAHKIVIE